MIGDLVLVALSAVICGLGLANGAMSLVSRMLGRRRGADLLATVEATAWLSVCITEAAYIVAVLIGSELRGGLAGASLLFLVVGSVAGRLIERRKEEVAA